MSDFVLHDHYFDPESGRISSYFCQLFVLIGQESLQYSILDTEKNSFIALADYRLPVLPKTPELFYSQLDRLISEEEVLHKKYPSVVVAIDSHLHTLVPSSLFDNTQMNKYLAFNFSLPQNYEVKSDRVEEIDAFNLYGFSEDIINFIRKNFQGAALIHRSTALIKAMYQYHQINPDPSGIFLNVRDQYIDLLYFDGNRLAYFNSFPCRSDEDILYFTLYTFGQLNLRPDTVHLFLSGMIDPGSGLFKLLEEYIQTITFTDRLKNFGYSPLADQVPSHHYQELFALALCGL